MARVSIKSICDELMPEFKTMAYIQKRLAKKLGKEVEEATVRAQANRLVREGIIDHAKAAKKYGIRGPKVEEGTTKTSKKSKADAPVKSRRKAKAAKDEAPAKSSKKKSEKVSKASSKKSEKVSKPSKTEKTRRRSKK